MNNSFELATYIIPQPEILPHSKLTPILELFKGDGNFGSIQLLNDTKTRELTPEEAREVNEYVYEHLGETRIMEELSKNHRRSYQRLNDNETVLRAKAILTTLRLRKDGKYIWSYLTSGRSELNRLREAVDSSLAILSNETSLKPIYNELRKIGYMYPRFSTEEAFKSYFIYLVLIF